MPAAGRLPRQALVSSQRLATQGMTKCWYARVSRWFDNHGLSIDRMPPLQYSLDAPHLDLTRQEINRIIRIDIQRLWIHKTWWPEQGLSTKLQFYKEQFIQWSQEGEIARPKYMETFMSHARRVAIGQIRVSSHQLQIEAGRAAGTPRERRICKLCNIGEVESEEHYICRCPIYYEIRGRYHCLFEEGFGPIRRIMDFSDQKCLGISLIELHKLRDKSLRQLAPEVEEGQRLITEFMGGQTVTRVTQRQVPPRTRGGRMRGGRTRSTRRRAQRPLAPRNTTSLTRQVRPRGVTLDTAKKIHRNSRPPPPTRRRPNPTQLQIRDLLERHKQRIRQSQQSSRIMTEAEVEELILELADTRED